MSLPTGLCCRNRSRHSRSEEHTSELQSHVNLVCRLLLEKKKKIQKRKFILRSMNQSFSTIIFFFNDTATTEIYTLSLHDALPIACRNRSRHSHSRARCATYWTNTVYTAPFLH